MKWRVWDVGKYGVKMRFTTIVLGSDGREYDKGRFQHLPDGVLPVDAFTREVPDESP